MILLSILAAAAVGQAPAKLVTSRVLAVRARVEATCPASAQPAPCRGAALAAPLSRRYLAETPGDLAAGRRLVIEY